MSSASIRPQLDNKAERASYLVWILTVTGIASTFAMLFMLHSALDEIRQGRRSVQSVYRFSNELFPRLNAYLNFDTMVRDNILDGNEPKSEDIQELNRTLEALKADAEPATHPELLQISRKMVGECVQLQQLHFEALEWNSNYRKNLQTFNSARDGFRQIIVEFRASVTSAEGRSKLALAGKIRQFQRAPAQEQLEMAQKLIQSSDPHRSVSEIVAELSNINVQTELMMSLSNADALTDYKDNQISQSLTRLLASISQVSDIAVRNEMEQHCNRAIVALFGEGYSFDRAHQMIVPGNSGIYSACKERLALLGLRAQIKSAAASLQKNIRDTRAKLEAEVALDYEQHAEVVEVLISNKWLLFLVLVMVLNAVFAVVARYIARAIRSQIEVIAEANSSLEQASKKEIRTMESLRASERSAREISALAMRNEQILHDFFDHAPMGIHWVDENGIILRANKAELGLKSTTRDAYIGKPTSDYYVDPVTPSSLLTRLRNNEILIGLETRIRRADGEIRDVVLDANAFCEGETFIHASFFTRDITHIKETQREREALEIQLHHAQKLESIGQLAAGIAHEINTPTQYIGDNLRFLTESFESWRKAYEAHVVLRKKAESGENVLLPALEASEAEATTDIAYLENEIPSALSQALEGVHRVTEIVGAMKEFSHPGQTAKMNVDVNKALQSTATVSRNEWKYLADLEFCLAPDLPPLPCISGELNQVILNLIVNASHAISDVTENGAKGKGRITISTRQDGEWIEISIADTGTGIPEHARERIFDPFFTTKELGKGTGQGLAIAQSVVYRKHGGTLTFKTEMGKGTTFFIRLPLTIELQEARMKARGSRAISKNGSKSGEVPSL